MAVPDAIEGSRRAATETTASTVFLAEVLVEPKPGVNDPQGEAILGGLRSLGYQGVNRVRSGRYFQIMIQAPNQERALLDANSMCERLLANPVIERFQVSIKAMSSLSTDQSAETIN